MYILDFISGLFVGLANIIPGVSGGSILYLTGHFEKILAIASQPKKVFSKEFITLQVPESKTLLFLTLGAVVGIFVFAKALTTAFASHAIYTWAFIFSFILASLLELAFNSKIKTRWIYLLLGIAFIAALSFLPRVNTNSNEELGIVYLFISGICAAASMILPGLSGSLVLIILGSYKNILNAVSNLEVRTILVVAIGAVIGLAFFIPLLKKLFKNRESQTHSFVLGLISASLIYTWPWQSGQIKFGTWRAIAPENNVENIVILNLMAIFSLIVFILLKKLKSKRA